VYYAGSRENAPYYCKDRKIPKSLFLLLKKEYGANLVLTPDQEVVNIIDTEWVQNIKKEIRPGDNLKIYREMRGWTQARLGELLGGIPRQRISNMERGSRKISLKTAKRLADLFDVSVERFV
jgi:DNA-binding XRE family transcriptional regulator